jgi:hypothetical protein
VDDYNRRAITALRHAQHASGARSANAFARLMAERAAGSPSASTYRRWITGEAIVPAWALQLAADVAGLSLSQLLADEPSGETPGDDWRARVEEAIGHLESEMIEVRQRVGLPWQSAERDATAGSSPTVQERSVS